MQLCLQTASVMQCVLALSAILASARRRRVVITPPARKRVTITAAGMVIRTCQPRKSRLIWRSHYTVLTLPSQLLFRCGLPCSTLPSEAPGPSCSPGERRLVASHSSFLYQFFASDQLLPSRFIRQYATRLSLVVLRI